MTNADKFSDTSEVAETLRKRFANHTPGLLGASRAYAALCPVVETSDGPSLLYEVRAAEIRQAGEVCFPGGRMEDGETPLQCALREMQEELSIPREYVTPLGAMDFICNQRGFLLYPIPAIVKTEGLKFLKASPAEVAETFTVPLSFLRENPPELYFYDLSPRPPADFPYEKIGIRSDYPWAPGRVEIPVWHWRGRVVWGMTARITQELVNSL